jgi:D-alanine-D-alanine ligase
MEKANVVLVTGPGGDAQGWGDMHVTEAVRDAISANGHECRVVWAEDRAQLEAELKKAPVSLVWSSLYFFSPRADIVGIPPDAVWVADVLDALGIPYIGPSAQTMKNLIGKFDTHEILASHGVRVPRHRLCPPSQPSEVDFFPAFVKPNGESRSVGISEKSVAEDPAALAAQVEFIRRELGQAALIEEYLPGKEYTVMVIGNGKKREVLPGQVTVPPERYGKYPILRSDMRGVGLTKISIPQEHREEAAELAAAACDALGCDDHVRIDMREDASGKLRIMEVNGIPGLKPGKSWSPQIYALYHQVANPYRALIGTIVNCALERAYGER